MKKYTLMFHRRNSEEAWQTWLIDEKVSAMSDGKEYDLVKEYRDRMNHEVVTQEVELPE